MPSSGMAAWALMPQSGYLEAEEAETREAAAQGESAQTAWSGLQFPQPRLGRRRKRLGSLRERKLGFAQPAKSFNRLAPPSGQNSGLPPVAGSNLQPRGSNDRLEEALGPPDSPLPTVKMAAPCR